VFPLFVFKHIQTKVIRSHLKSEVPSNKFQRFPIYFLIVLPPGMGTFGAAEEPYFAFISSPQLAQPPDCEVVVAFRAPDLDGGHGFYFFILIINNGDLVLGAFLLFLHLVSPGDLPDIPAFPAL
jgi:hypothetical protein